MKVTDEMRSAVAREMGLKGGPARAKKLSAKRRREIAMLGVHARAEAKAAREKEST